MMIRNQRGATLVIALIMLVLLTLFALSAMNTGTTNLRIVGNMQTRAEAFTASEQAIETVISTPTFIVNPANAVLNACGAPNTLCTDMNADGTPEYTTTLTPIPACVSVQPIKVTDLNLTNADDVGCTQQQAQTFGVAGSGTGNSLCANTIWEINAVTTAASSGATSAVTQGVGVRISTDDMATSCL